MRTPHNPADQAEIAREKRLRREASEVAHGLRARAEAAEAKVGNLKACIEDNHAEVVRLKEWITKLEAGSMEAVKISATESAALREKNRELEARLKGAHGKIREMIEDRDRAALDHDGGG